MLTKIKRSHFGYPVRFIYFPDDPEVLPSLRPWEAALGIQASDAVKECLAPCTVKAVPYHTLISDLTQPARALFDRVHSKRRNRLRHAERIGINVSRNVEDADALYASFAQFYRSKSLAVPPRANFDLIYHTCEIYTAYYEQEPIIHHMVMVDQPHRACMQFGWHNTDNTQTNALRGSANIYLCWWEMLHFRDRGFQEFDWGGVVTDRNSPAYSRTEFKVEFGGELRREWYLVLLGTLLRPIWHLARRRVDTIRLEE